ncbi:MAG: hypothetical protein AMXMBFR17_05880 [Candidatus Jettenia caeni]|nr:MAG: hypothetical protein JETCAE04_01020 [Candidatus Jettenia caeni]
MDRIWERHQLEKKLGARIVRFADDFIILCRQGTEQPMAITKRVLDKLGLTLNEAKSHVVDAMKEGT